MSKKYEKIIERDFKRAFSRKRFLLNILFMILIFIYHEFFCKLIFEYLTPKDLNNSLVSVLFILLLSIFLVGAGFKILKDKYSTSTNEINLLFLSLFLIYYFNYCCQESKWFLVEIKFLGLSFTYVSLLIFTLITILTFIFQRYLNGLGEIKKINSENNILLDDSPISKQDKDELDYEETVRKLSEILKKDNHKKSFTIGLVGPWGNGKSSVLKMVKKELSKTNKNTKSDIIIFDFLPYLNHKENDIINEFFTALSNELKPYNGKLSNLITEYSSKLTDLYENKNVLGFIENQVSHFDKSAASELYKLINEMLVDINKKIIVFVDDLDRLSKDEILQVLKLIRNTADFRNAFFVVAMDKEYVLKSLKKSKKIFHSSFIDKFFQLEIYLPEIQKSKLRLLFIDEILKSKLNDGSPLFEVLIKDAVNNHDNLFDDYIKNIRDIKRTVNQLIYDYPTTGGEVNLKDFMNFTYFKLKFPNFVKIITQGIGDFIEVNTDGLYKLTEADDKKNTDVDTTDRLFKYISKRQVFNPKKYKIYNEDLFENCLILDSSLDCENKFLLIKTLAYLFGNENKINDVNSIKYESNLNILLEQRVYKNRLLNIEFKELLKSNLDDIFKTVDFYYKENKLTQLMSRFEFFSASKDENEIKNAILTLVYILEKKFIFNINESTILNQIGIFANKFENPEISLKDWSLENIFKNKKFSIETRVNLASKLKNAGLGTNYDFNFWGYRDKKELNTLVLKLYDEYLKYKDNKLNDVNNYSFYHIYHEVKIENEKEIIKRFINFWRNNNLEMLCAQLTDMDTWSTLSFKISEIVIEIFGSREAYIEFVKNHKESDENAIKEFLKLYAFLAISNFKNNFMYTFEKSKLMKEKIEHRKKNGPKRDENENVIQIVLETNSKTFIDALNTSSIIINKYDLRIEKTQITNGELFYIFAYLKKSLGADPVLIYTQDLYQNIIPLLPDWEKGSFVANYIRSGLNLIPQQNNNNYIKVISKEPKDNNYNLDYEIY
ncbi:KAP family P-loop NTPase fold protein [Flavobacterium sp. RSB2_4_14]|uniref:KAP family P-loop NTPase fold protein n=1 Tax=Flavobacterium sp. RSB2_4_14 TaxID=3447665 RepID=UPI003F2B2B39